MPASVARTAAAMTGSKSAMSPGSILIASSSRQSRSLQTYVQRCVAGLYWVFSMVCDPPDAAMIELHGRPRQECICTEEIAMDRHNWSQSVSQEEASRRAAGRRRYNA